jgi:hypothetical protein
MMASIFFIGSTSGPAGAWRRYWAARITSAGQAARFGACETLSHMWMGNEWSKIVQSKFEK